jgi:predicted RNase H-like nuclease (RuvC/YqgF family)
MSSQEKTKDEEITSLKQALKDLQEENKTLKLSVEAGEVLLENARNREAAHGKEMYRVSMEGLQNVAEMAKTVERHKQALKEKDEAGKELHRVIDELREREAAWEKFGDAIEKNKTYTCAVECGDSHGICGDAIVAALTLRPK